MDLTAIVRELDVPDSVDVLVGFRTGDDAGVYRVAPGVNLVMTADFIPPPCDDPYLFGRIAAANSLSDVYAMGGTPKAALNLCCFPIRSIDRHTLAEILRGGLDTLSRAGVALVGGHTVRDDELKYGLSVTGIVRDEDVKTNTTARSGDLLVLTKPIGTGIVVGALRSGLIREDEVRPVLERMAELNQAAAVAMLAFRGVHAVTDVTGFGLGGHALGMAEASHVGLRFQVGRVPQWSICADLIAKGVKTGVVLSDSATERKIQFDPRVSPAQQMMFYDPQTSGGLLMSVAAGEAEPLVRRLVEAGIPDAAVCGEAFAAEHPHLEVIP